MAGLATQFDALVLGNDTPAALAALALREKSKQVVGLVRLPGYAALDHLGWINPKIFELHPALEEMRRSLPLTGIHGIVFLDVGGQLRAEWRNRSGVVLSGSAGKMADFLTSRLDRADIRPCRPKRLKIMEVDESGVRLAINGRPAQTRLLLVSTPLPPTAQSRLGLEPQWPAGVLHRRAWIHLPCRWLVDPKGWPMIAACLNLDSGGSRGWLIPNRDGVDLAVDTPLIANAAPAMEALLGQWSELLRQFNLLKSRGKLPMKSVQSADWPLSGALSREPVGKHTLIFGKAGGFISATGEDLYPGIASALAAVHIAHKALKETNLQDALQPYRSKWRAGLGNYLRGPEQQMPLLLPLVYRNPTMAARLGEAILLGKSMVR